MNSARSAVNALVLDLEKVLFALATSDEYDLRNRIKTDGWAKMSTMVVANNTDHMPKELILIIDEIDRHLSTDNFDPDTAVRSIVTLFVKAVESETRFS